MVHRALAVERSISNRAGRFPLNYLRADYSPERKDLDLVPPHRANWCGDARGGGCLPTPPHTMDVGWAVVGGASTAHTSPAPPLNWARQHTHWRALLTPTLRCAGQFPMAPRATHGYVMARLSAGYSTWHSFRPPHHTPTPILLGTRTTRHSAATFRR